MQIEARKWEPLFCNAEPGKAVPFFTSVFAGPSQLLRPAEH